VPAERVWDFFVCRCSELVAEGRIELPTYGF